MSAKLIAIIVLLILLLIFAIQNTQPVVLNFLFWQISTSFVLSILVSFVLTGCLLMMIGRMKKRVHRLDYSFSNLLSFPFARFFARVLMSQAKLLKGA